jgi:hypothetical protein
LRIICSKYFASFAVGYIQIENIRSSFA